MNDSFDPFDSDPDVIPLDAARRKKSGEMAPSAPDKVKVREMIRLATEVTVAMQLPDQYPLLIEGQCYALACLAHEAGVPLETLLAAVRMEYNGETTRRQPVE